MIMTKALAAALVGLSVLAGAALPAMAADCQLKGWNDSGTNTRPIFVCPDQNSN
jgi:hypothetical protein